MADEKLIFPIGFDLEKGVREVQKDWKKYQPEIQKTIDRNPLKLKLELSAKGFNISELKKYIGLSKEIAKANREIAKTRSENALAAQRESRQRVQEATELDQIKQKKAQAALAEERLRQAKERSAKTTHEQNVAYKTQSGYLQRLFQRMVAYASVAQAFSFVRNVRDVTAEFELQRVALGSIIGDLNEANAMFEQIKAAAVKSPFQIKELVTYTKQLAAYKIESDELFETTQRLADISAGLGVGMERLVLAYGQIRATGYLRASEVRQLTEAGIPIVEELAKKMSQLRSETVSAAEVMGLISERAISFGMVKEVFDDMTSAGGMFYKMQEKQAETLAGQWSNLQDAISIMYEEIGNTEGAQIGIKDMIGLVKSLAENWRDVWSVVQSLSVAMGVYYVTMKNATMASKALSVAEATRLSTLRATTVYMPKFLASTKLAITLTRAYRVSVIKSATATGLLSKAFWGLTKAMLSNPYTAVLAALAGLATLLLTTESRAKRLNKELAKIGTEGALQADQSVRNFERLAKTIRESADGSREQSEALAELKRTYGDLLPAQDKEILALVKVKEGYEDVTTAIREKINAQIYEQKMNTIISEYGTNLANKQKKPKKWLENMGFSVEETTRIFNAIDKAVQEGLIKVEDDVVTQARKIEKIIKDQTGKVVNLTESQYARVAGTNQTIYTGEKATRLANKLSDLVGVYSDFNNSVNELADSQKRASNITWEYQEGYDKLKDSIAETNAQFNENTFARGESIKANTLAKWREYFISLSDIFAKTPEGGIVDFTALEDEIEKLPANLRAHIRVVQKEYEKLIPTDITRLANDKLQEYANEVGISMDDVKEHLKTNEQSTEDWAKGLKGAYESLEKKLAEYKLNRDNAISIGKKTHWSKEVEEVEDEMKVLKLLMDFFKEFLSGGGGKKTNPRIALLNEELSTVEKIYKEYQELRKFMSEDDARARVADMFEGVNLTMLSQALSPTEMRQQLQKALDEAKKLGDEKQILEFEYKLGKFDADEAQRKMEKNLKKLSDDLSRTKTAKEFFDRMLGMTGDKEFSASLTLSVYGEGGDLGKKLAKQTIEQLETAFEGVDISSAIDKTTGKVDYAKLAPLVEQLPEKAQANAQALVNAGEKANADWLTDLQKTYQKAFTFEERRTQVMKEEAQKRKEIEESASLTPEQKAKYTEASRKKEAERISAINIEEFKESEDYLKIFEDIERLSIPTIERLIAKLREVIATNKELSATDLKHLTEQINNLEDGLVKKNAWAGLLSGIRDLQKARKTISQTAKGTKEYADAMDDANKANVKIQNALGGLQSEFSQAQQLIESFADTLGIAEDSDFGVFLNGMAEAVGGVSKALAFAQLAVQLFDGTIKSFLASNPIGWILLIVSAIISAVQAIMNARVNRINEEIERLQDHLDNLEYSFERLQKAQEKAFGGDYISNYEQRLANLQAQQEAYLKQADAERSKGKKADEDKIKEYEEAYREATDNIKDMQNELSENFLGTDLTSAARDFANAWIDAYKEFGSTTDAMKEKFQDMIQNMIVESFAARVIASALEDVFDEIDKSMSDGIFDMSEATKVTNMTNQAIDNIDVGMTNLMNALEQAGISVRGMGSGLTGISRDIATASEESILGLAAGINTQNFYISQVPTKLDTIIGLLRGDGAMPQGSAMTLQDVMIAQNQFLSHLPTIAQHTAETVAECKAIVVETRRTADALERVIKPDGTRTTYKMNVVTSYQG